MLQISERPPLRLSVNIETPSGMHARWGSDDPDPSRKPQALSFGTSMPGGFADMGCTLARDPRRDWPDTEELSDVKVRDPGGEIAWEGRLEKLPDTGGSQSQLSPQAVGYQSHLDDDNTAREIYLDGAFGGWQGASIRRQIFLQGGGVDNTDASVSADPMSGEPALVTQMTGPWSRPNVSEGWYDAKGISIGHLYYAWKLQAPGAIGNDVTTDPDWEWAAFLAPDDAALTTDATPNLKLALTTLGVLDATVEGRVFGLVELEFTAAGGNNGVNYPVFWTYLGVVGSHGLPIQGELTQTGGIGILASDVSAHAVRKWAPKLKVTTGPNGSIRPSSYAIPQLAFTDPTTTSAIIKQAVQYELLDWAVWEGPTFYQNARGESVKTRNWRARIGAAQLQETGPDISRIWNGVTVSYTGVDGIARMVGPPGSGATIEDARLLDSDPQNPASQAGLRRWAPLSLGTTTPDGALQVGQVFLRVQKLADTSGQASLMGHVLDDKGVWWPAWMVRAGDTITFTDARNTSPRRIVSTSYDHASKTNAVQLDQPPDIMAELLAGMSEAIAPFGLS